MSVLGTLRDVILGAPLALPQTEALSHVDQRISPYALDGQVFQGFDDPALAEFFRTGNETGSGVVVNERMALRNSATYRAVKLITSALGMLPLNIYERTEETRKVTNEKTGETTTETTDGATIAKEHPVQSLLKHKPNSFQTPFEFKTYMVGRALFHGITYAFKDRRVSAKMRGGFAEQLIPLDPRLVEPKMESNFRLHFVYHDPKGPPIDIPAERMFWFRSPWSSDGVTGAKLLDVAREAMGVAHQSERAVSRVLRNGAIVGGVLEHPKALDEPAINRLRSQFEERQSSPENAGRWIVAEDGLKVSQHHNTTLRDVQNAELRKFQIEEIARFTGVPRPLLMMDETSWGTGIEQLGLFFITYCLLPWFTTIEEAIQLRLLSEADQDKHYAKFNEGALLRGSLKDQSEFFAKALGSGGGRGWMTQNEVRGKFELNPKEGGDELPEPITKQPGSDGDGQDADEKGDDAIAPKKPKKPSKGD